MGTAELIREQGWYHTLDLGEAGTTEGWFDLRPIVDNYGLPKRMDGMRALDVGTWDGFWAFEMERRGAEVVALDLDDEADLDWPPRRRPAETPATPRGAGFRLAHEILGSSVERVNLSIYRATPEELGEFDFCFCGSVLIHLRDQLLALERIAGLCRGTFVSAEAYDRLASVLPFPTARYVADAEASVVFWRPAISTWRRMLWTAGFDRVDRVGKFMLKSADGKVAARHVVHRCAKG